MDRGEEEAHSFLKEEKLRNNFIKILETTSKSLQENKFDAFEIFDAHFSRDRKGFFFFYTFFYTFFFFAYFFLKKILGKRAS